MDTEDEADRRAGSQADPQPDHRVDDEALGAELGGLAAGDVSASKLRSLAGLLSRSARAAGTKSVASGKWVAHLVVDDLAPRVPIRDLATLQEQHGGLSGPALAGELIKHASRVAGALGAASGALIGAEELAPPAWVTIPIELVVETLAIAAVELKLIAELHEVFGRPVRGSGTERGMALARAWADRRGVQVGALAVGAGGLREALGHGTKHELMRQVRKRLIRRLGRSSLSAAPFLAGAAIGAGVNSRGTRALGEAVVRDLAGPRPPR